MELGGGVGGSWVGGVGGVGDRRDVIRPPMWQAIISNLFYRRRVSGPSEVRSTLCGLKPSS